jgi:peptide chain release factor 2
LTVVSAAEYPEQLKALDATLRNIENVLDVEKLRRVASRDLSCSG